MYLENITVGKREQLGFRERLFLTTLWVTRTNIYLELRSASALEMAKWLMRYASSYGY